MSATEAKVTVEVGCARNLVSRSKSRATHFFTTYMSSRPARPLRPQAHQVGVEVLLGSQSPMEFASFRQQLHLCNNRPGMAARPDLRPSHTTPTNRTQAALQVGNGRVCLKRVLFLFLFCVLCRCCYKGLAGPKLVVWGSRYGSLGSVRSRYMRPPPFRVVYDIYY